MTERTTVHVPGEKEHRNPIPTCVRLGNLILPSVISGISGLPDGVKLTPEEEIERAFQRMKKLIEGAGGSLQSIGKVTVYMYDFKHRELVNKSWLKMFPDPDNRPARHCIPLPTPGLAVVSLDVIATVD